MENKNKNVLGVSLIIIGFAFVTFFSGNTAGYRVSNLQSIFEGLSYIGGYTMTFGGLYLILKKEKGNRVN